jgi:hypothetical protein
MLTKLDTLDASLKEFTDEQVEKIFKKANYLQTHKNVITNTLGEDMSKGTMRNEICPNCKKKFKRCNCGVKLSDVRKNI